MQLVEGLQFDAWGRLAFHPEIHPNHGTRWSEEDLEYLCKYVDSDGPKGMEMALGRTEKTVKQKVSELKKIGRFDYYKNLNEHW